MPGFSHSKDEVARKQLEKIYQIEAVTVQTTELVEKVGIINCVTWTY